MVFSLRSMAWPPGRRELGRHQIQHFRELVDPCYDRRLAPVLAGILRGRLESHSRTGSLAVFGNKCQSCIGYANENPPPALRLVVPVPEDFVEEVGASCATAS